MASMRINTVMAALVLACLGLPAQQGHPLTGTWNGDWGASVTQRNQVTIVMNWDGKNVTGILNPGPDSAPLAGVFVDPTNWTVRFEADAKDASGKPVHIAAEGHLADIGSYHRTLSGSWTQGTVKGDFKLTRD
ncbi:MAG TPA: hypothetical protein VGG72_06625 [Bryobacteraceae bacterium]